MRCYQAYIAASRVSEYMLTAHAVENLDRHAGEYWREQADRAFAELAEWLGYRVERQKMTETPELKLGDLVETIKGSA